MKRTMTVTGTGSASATPDTVTLTLGVETRRDTAERAYSDAGAAATAVAAALRSEGVLEADLRTSGLNLRADSVWAEGQGQKVTGYVATAALHVGLRSPSSAPAVIASAVAAGGDAIRINGLEQGFADVSGLIASAQQAAWSDALAKAQRYARLAVSSSAGSSPFQSRHRPAHPSRWVGWYVPTLPRHCPWRPAHRRCPQVSGWNGTW